MRRSTSLAVLLLLTTAVARLGAQDTARVSPNDSIFRRARRMVAEGKGTAGRALVDTVLHRYEEGSTGYGDAMFWRGALAETAADAERDYRRVIVEYPLSFYVDDALLAIAELEQARGDRAAALAHLQRFVREHAITSPARGIAAFAAARLAFEQRDNRTACGLITDAKTSTPVTNVELRNQIEYYVPRCASDPSLVVSAQPVVKDTTPPPPTPAPVQTAPATPPKKAPAIKPVPKPAPARADTSSSTKPVVMPDTAKPPVTAPTAPATKSPAVKPPAPVQAAPAPVEAPVAPRGIYTIQVAAYNSQAEAEALVKKLAARDVKARVSGTSKPFRVRLDFFATRAEATAETAALKQRGIIGFVTTEEPEGKKP